MGIGLRVTENDENGAVRIGETDDEAQLSRERKGGIDLNPAIVNLTIEYEDRGFDLPLPQGSLENLHIEDLTPVIINVVPVSNILPWIGLADDSEGEPQLTRR